MGVEEDILTAITGGFLFVMGVGLWVGKTCFYSTTFLSTEASNGRQVGSTHHTIMFCCFVMNLLALV